MNEFIKKLIGRLEEQKSDLTTWAEDKAFEIGIETAVSIVKQLAEEFATDKNVGHNNQDLMIVESLPSLYPMMQPFEVESIHRVVRSAKHSGGWIPVAKNLPKEDMWCWATFESGNVDKIKYLASQKWWNGEMGDNRVIAWQPLPDPFKPIAE